MGCRYYALVLISDEGRSRPAYAAVTVSRPSPK